MVVTSCVYCLVVVVVITVNSVVVLRSFYLELTFVLVCWFDVLAVTWCLGVVCLPDVLLGFVLVVYWFC